MKRLAKDKLIVALDVPTARQARELVSSLRQTVGMFKIGSQLFTAAGPDLVREIVKSGERVFLDLKFHDIPNTVAAAGVEAARLGVTIFNVHAAGGGEMMRRTAHAVQECAEALGQSRPLIIAVTVLTSTNQTMLDEVRWNSNPDGLVKHLAVLAAASGMDGLVASPREVGIVREAVTNREFIVVTPGVRPAGSSASDQKRVATPREAMMAGADYLVVGRPILEAADPVRAAVEIINEMEMGSRSMAP